MSDSDEDIDLAAHGKLLSSIQSLDGKKKQKNAIRGMPVAPNNLDLVVHASRDSSKIKAEDLKMKQRHGKTELKKPLSSGELETAKRKIARETMVNDTSKWDPIVHNMRLAPQINYTQQNESIEVTKRRRPWGFQPTTPLELELFAALGKSENVLRPDKEFTAAEEKALKAMSFKEAQMRRNELMKHHELLSRAGQKAKRLKKIKSKKYRKILRREKEASDRKELEQLQKTDPEAFIEKMEQLDRARMEERLTLKHKGGGKFSRLHKAYSKFDDKTRTAVQDMLQKSKELTQKREDPSSSEDDEGDDAQAVKPSQEENNEEGGDAVNSKVSKVTPSSIAKLAGGWLDGPTKYVYTTPKADAQKDLSPENEKDESCVKEVSVENVSEGSKVNEDKSQGDELKKKKKRKRKKNSPGDEEKEAESTSTGNLDEGEKTDAAEAPKKKKRKKKKKNKGKGEDVDESASKSVHETMLSVVDEEGGEKEEEEGEGDAEDDNMKVSMEELFQDEDFVEEFAKDTAELEAKNRPKVKDTKLPGWGSWAGPDYKEKPQKKLEAKKTVVKNKPAKQVTVWLNPQRNDSIRKFQPKTVPFPYKTVEQYESSLRQPVSRGFVRETAHKLLTKPEIVTKLGHIIKPLQKEHYITKQPEFEET